MQIKKIAYYMKYKLEQIEKQHINHNIWNFYKQHVLLIKKDF